MKDLNLTVLIEEDVMGTNIAYFYLKIQEVVRAVRQGKQNVPQFALLKVFSYLLSVLNLIHQDVGANRVSELQQT